MTEQPLWKTDPVKWVGQMLICAQKARGILRDSMGADEQLLALIHPWLFGEKSILPLLSKMATSSQIGPGEIFNLASVLSRCPALGMQMTVLGIDVPSIEEVMQWLSEIDALRGFAND